MTYRTTRKGKFSTYLFSLLPGGGQMYLGFMKQGLSLLILFFSIILFSTWLYIDELCLLLPIIWFYSFFDSLNKNGMTDQELNSQEDRFLFRMDDVLTETVFKSRFRPVIAAGMIFTGAYLLLKNFLDMFVTLLPERMARAMVSAFHTLPQLVFSLLIIYIGFRLITAKKQELLEDKNN